MGLEKEYLVEKRNVLNEIRSNTMSLQELRFFSIYLSKINARDPETRKVSFLLYDFQRIMGLVKQNINHLKYSIDSLLCKVVHVPKVDGGFSAFQIFKKCDLSKNKSGEWYIEIDAHDDALPLMFDFKDNYFTYKLWNALRLKSANQLRMYEILKQCERIGYRIIRVDKLKEYLGIEKDEYKVFSDFKKSVLEACRVALEENTDIRYTYEPHLRGARGKILELKFTICKNKNYKDPLNLEDFINLGKYDENIIDGECKEVEPPKYENERIRFFAGSCNDEFSEKEMQIIYNYVTKIVFYEVGKNMDIEYYNYLKHKYDELNYRADKSTIKNRFGYLRKIVEVDLADYDT